MVAIANFKKKLILRQFNPFLIMKKIIFTLSLLFASFAIAASCAKANGNRLPADAQTFLDTHFPNVAVTHIDRETDGFDVYLANGFEIDFARSGKWREIENYTLPVPAGIVASLPSAISEFVSANYPNQFITSIERKNNGFEVYLNNRLELEFNLDGTLRRIDND